jgi:hypothetical protein
VCVFVALVIQYAKRMLHAIWSPVACAALQYFFTLSHKRHNFLENVIEYKTLAFFSLQSLSRTFPILRITQRDTVIGLNVKTFSRISIKLKIFSTDFRQISNIKYHENPSSGSRIVSCGQTYVRKDRYDEANSCLSQSCDRV